MQTHHAKQQSHRLAAPRGVLSFPMLAPDRLAPAPLEEADLSVTALPVAVRPATDRPTDTTWSGDVL